MKQFASFASAGVPPGFARPGGANPSHRLRAEVLDFKRAALKFWRPKKILRPVILQRVSQDSITIRAAAPKLRGQRSPLPFARPQPQPRLSLNRANPFRVQLHFTGQP